MGSPKPESHKVWKSLLNCNSVGAPLPAHLPVMIVGARWLVAILRGDSEPNDENSGGLLGLFIAW